MILCMRHICFQREEAGIYFIQAAMRIFHNGNGIRHAYGKPRDEEVSPIYHTATPQVNPLTAGAAYIWVLIF